LCIKKDDNYVIKDNLDILAYSLQFAGKKRFDVIDKKYVLPDKC